MDELIRELEQDRDYAQERCVAAPFGSRDASYWAGELAACGRHLASAKKAKRTMADREPAWEVSQ